MDALSRMKHELERRVRSLDAEVESWSKAAEANLDGFGIHRNQVRALVVMLRGLDQRLQEQVKALDASSLSKFSEPYVDAIEELVAVHDVWSVFQEALLQRGTPSLKEKLDAADLIAADCYRKCIARAESWGVLSEDTKRPPPLAMIEPRTSAATVGRGEAIGLLGHPQRRYRELKLTVPVVLLPPDQLGSMWLLAAIFHEIGHNLDQDLGLVDALKSKILDLDDAKKLGATGDTWWKWTGEMVADAVGVLLGGGPFASSLGNMLDAVSASARYAEIERTDPHPNPHVRTLILCALVEQLGAPEWTAIAKELRTRWDAAPHPAWVADFRPHVDVITATLLDAKLDVLAKHTLRELVPTPRAQQLAQLAKHFLHNFNAPDEHGDHISHRFVPAAAELAFSAWAGEAGGLDAIHARALAYLNTQLTRPQFLGMSDANRGHLEQLTAKLDLRKKI